MATFVLVHGAWHGGWCYRDTAQALRAAGHTVHTPTHTGVGDRAHQSAENITLETHIRDVCGVIEAEELTDVILCGHSYGGMVISGVADRLPGRIRALVYLDAFVPEHGQSLIGLIRQALPPEVAAVFLGFFPRHRVAKPQRTDGAHPGRDVRHKAREPGLGRPPLRAPAAGHL